LAGEQLPGQVANSCAIPYTDEIRLESSQDLIHWAWFLLFAFPAIAVFIISGFPVILIGPAGVISCTTLLNRSHDTQEKSITGMTKSAGLIPGMVLALLIAFKLLSII